MRPHRRRGLITGVLGLACLTVGGSTAFGHWFSGRGGGYAATEYVAVAPTSYLLSTSYLVPTAYFVPTTYVTTGYAVEETSYLVPSYFATSYVVPTTQYFATSARFPSWYETSYEVLPTSIAMASDPCGSAVIDPCATVASTSVQAPMVVGPDVSHEATAPPVVSSQSPVYSETPSASPKRLPDPVPSTVRPAPRLESIPDDQPESPAEATGAEPTTKRNTAPPGGGAGQAPATDAGVPSPPIAPVPEREPAQPLSEPSAITPIEPPAPGGQPPVAPSGNANPIEVPKIQELEARTREVRRPVMPAMSRSGVAERYRRQAQGLGVLEGKVVSGESGVPESGVRVTLVNRAKTFVDRVLTTDPAGHYAVRLPDGDWTVKVSMPSGKVYAVSQLTVSQGQISDDLGRDIPTLVITR